MIFSLCRVVNKKSESKITVVELFFCFVMLWESLFLKTSDYDITLLLTFCESESCSMMKMLSLMSKSFKYWVKWDTLSLLWDFSFILRASEAEVFVILQQVLSKSQIMIKRQKIERNKYESMKKYLTKFCSKLIKN